MTIQRVTFEDRGQDVRWWEIDMETGRIVGCGPRLANLWASGRCSVDVDTIQHGLRPTFHGPATEPEGRSFLWEIVDIQAAETGEGK